MKRWDQSACPPLHPPGEREESLLQWQVGVTPATVDRRATCWGVSALTWSARSSAGRRTARARSRTRWSAQAQVKEAKMLVRWGGQSSDITCLVSSHILIPSDITIFWHLLDTGWQRWWSSGEEWWWILDSAGHRQLWKRLRRCSIPGRLHQVCFRGSPNIFTRLFEIALQYISYST